MLNAGDREGFAQLLETQRKAGNPCLDFEGQSLNDAGLKCLAQVFKKQLKSTAGLHIKEIRFCDAELGDLAPLMDSLSAVGGAGIASLDFSGAQSLSPGYAKTGGALGLDESALRSIARLVSTSTVLRNLKLNRQPALGLLMHMDRLAKQLHTEMRPPLMSLMKALETSGLQTLELRDCGLNSQDWGNLAPVAQSATLKCFDMRGNDQMTRSERADECRCMLAFITKLDKNTSLEDVRLPAPAADWFRAGIRSFKDPQAYPTTLGLPNNRTLRVLSPLTDTQAPVLKDLADRVAKRTQEALALVLCVREAHFRVPSDLEKLLVKSVFERPNAPSPH